MKTRFYKQIEVADGFTGERIVVYLCKDTEAGQMLAVCSCGFYAYGFIGFGGLRND